MIARLFALLLRLHALVASFYKNEPLRARIYTLALLVAGYLLAQDYVSATDYEFIGSALAIVLGVERARSKVTPLSKHRW